MPGVGGGGVGISVDKCIIDLNFARRHQHFISFTSPANTLLCVNHSMPSPKIFIPAFVTVNRSKIDRLQSMLG